MAESLVMMPWYEGNFLKATLGWTFVQRSLYRCLLAASWELGSLPTDEAELSRIAGTDERQWSEAWPRVKSKFVERDGRLVNEKLEEIRIDALERRERKRRAGRTGGEASGKARAKQPFNGRSTDVEAGTKPTSTSTTSEDSPSESPAHTSGADAQGGRKTAKRLPPDFALTPERRAIAEREKVDPDRTFLKFKNHWLAQGGQNARKHDWDRAWENWCIKESDGKQNSGAGRKERLSAAERVERATGVRLK